jgi:hypothetical protein
MILCYYSKFELVPGMRWIFINGLIFLLFASCDKTERSPEYVTYRTLPEGAGIQYEKENFVNERQSFPVEGVYPGLDSLIRLRLTFFDEQERFDIDRFMYFWDEFRQEVRTREISREEADSWFNLTGFLFQITGDAMVAEELEHIVWQHFLIAPGATPDSLILPYVFTRNNDFIHLNLYLPASIHYQHSMGGKVTITQETDFPEDDTIRIVFGMETKQYIELYVRIPSWAEDASVTVKGVKYLAVPGSYSQIAKKWKEGDMVEVEIPVENLPAYMTPGD